MKRIFYIFLFLLIASPAWATSYFPFFAGGTETRAYFALPNPTGSVKDLDAQIKTINAGGSVTLSGLTCDLSLVDGTSFITNPSVDLRKYVGFKITVSASGQTLVGWIKAAGTGETTNTVYTSDFSAGLDGWAVEFGTGYGSSGTFVWDTDKAVLSVTAPTGFNTRPYIKKLDIAGMNTGALHKLEFDYAVISGTVKLMGLIFGGGYTNPEIILSGTGTYNAGYQTSSGAQNDDILLYFNGYNYTFSLDILAVRLKNILTPSATGITIVSEKDGSTYNWTSNSGINPNSASFTAVITKE